MSSARLHIPCLINLCVLLTLGGCLPSGDAPENGDDTTDSLYDPAEVDEDEDEVMSDDSDETADDSDETADDSDETADDPGENSDDGDGTEDESSSEEPLLSPEECDILCSDREDTLDDNSFCSFDMLSGDCPTVCDEYSAFQRSTQESFATCVAADPLCYQDIHDCVAIEVYPGATVADLTLAATGFDADAGKPVVIGVQVASANFSMLETEVTDAGEFEGDWTESVHVSRSQLVLYYVDQNENGACDPGVDLTGSAYLERSADIDNLSFSAWIGRPEYAMDFVCDYL